MHFSASYVSRMSCLRNDYSLKMSKIMAIDLPSRRIYCLLVDTMIHVI